MNKIHAGLFAAMLALGGGSAALAHGHGGGGAHFSGGGHMSSFHSSSFHSSPSFHSSFHSNPSFHSSPSFHSNSSFHSRPSFNSNSFHSSPSFNSSAGSFSGFGFGSRHSRRSTPDANINSGPSTNSGSGLDSFFGHHHSRAVTSQTGSPQTGINNDTGSHHGGFLFWGHHRNDNNVNAVSGDQSGVNAVSNHHHHHDNNVNAIGGDQSGINTTLSDHHHHGGFLFWGHHHNDNSNTPAFGDGAPANVAYGHHHHHHQNLNNINMYPISVAPPPSTMIINMAPPPRPQAVPLHSLAITKYFYPQPQMSYNSRYFGGYGSTYGGYGYFPTRGLTSLLFRLMSLIGFGSRSNYGTGLNSNAYLGTWGPQSSLTTGAFDNTNSTNFVDNYANFNYTGGNVQPFANLLPDGTPYGDNAPQNLALQNSDAQTQSGQTPDMNQSLLSMNSPTQFLPPSLSGQVTDNAIADPQNPVELKATAQALQPEVAFKQPNYAYHHMGVLGSAFTHNIKLSAGDYRAPEILGMIFTHEFGTRRIKRKTTCCKHR